MPEVWKGVPGFEGFYEVSDHGRVRSIDRMVLSSGGRLVPRPGVMLSLSPDGHGYPQAVLSKENRQTTRKVAVLVLHAFVGPCPKGMESCHNDGNRQNSDLDNLRWDTRSANALDRVLHGTHSESRKTHCPQGHEYSPANTGRRKDNSRWCKTCDRARSAAAYARRTAA